MLVNDLRKTKEVLITNGWTQGTIMREGRVCLIGAANAALTGNPFNSCIGEEGNKLVRALRTAVGYHPGSPSLSRWNDTLGRTFEEVIAVIDKAILECSRDPHDGHDAHSISEPCIPQCSKYPASTSV